MLNKEDRPFGGWIFLVGEILWPKLHFYRNGNFCHKPDFQANEEDIIGMQSKTPDLQAGFGLISNTRYCNYKYPNAGQTRLYMYQSPTKNLDISIKTSIFYL